MIQVGENNVICVAHCDDETLWCAGLPLRYPDREWTVIACSIPRHDPIRAEKFHQACEVLGVKGIVLETVETGPGEKLNGLEAVDLSPFDCIITHNAAGEYGHSHHKHVHEFVKERWLLSSKFQQLITFGYRKNGLGAISLELSSRELFTKQEALMCYNHVSPLDGRPKWEALTDVYYTGMGISPSVETYDSH